MIREEPLAWYLIGLCYIGILIGISMVLGIISLICAFLGVVGDIINLAGNVFYYAIAPCFTVGIIAAGWTQARGGKPKVSHLFSGFKADVKTLMGVGVTFFALMVFSFLIPFLVLLLGGDFLTEAENLAKAGDPMVLLRTLLTSAHLWLAIAVYLILSILAWVAYWLAPMVVVFQRTGVMAALWRSFKGLLINNWRALIVFLLPVLAVGAFIGIIVAIAIKVALGMSGGEPSMLVIMLILLFVFLMLIAEFLVLPFLISLGTMTAFVAYCDIFHAKDGVFPRPVRAKAVGNETTNETANEAANETVNETTNETEPF